MDNRNKIPKIIHYCWLGENEIPDKDKRHIEQWKRMCPDYKFMFWNEKNYDISKIRYMREAYENRKWGFVPDYLRLDVVYNYGGIYLDTDVEMRKSFDMLLSNKAFVGFENEKKINLGSGFGAEPHNPIIKKMMDFYEDVAFVQKDGKFNLVPSPVFQTQVLKECGLVCNGQYQELENITVYPAEILSPLDFMTGELKETEKTISIHWYNASWHTQEEKRIIEQARTINKIFGKKIGFRICQLVNGYRIVKNNGLKGIKQKLIEKRKKRSVSD